MPEVHEVFQTALDSFDPNKIAKEQPHPAKTALSMWAIGKKENKYSKNHLPPITLVKDKDTAEALLALLETAGDEKPYIVEVPFWPAMRTED